MSSFFHENFYTVFLKSRDKQLSTLKSSSESKRDMLLDDTVRS